MTTEEQTHTTTTPALRFFARCRGCLTVSAFDAPEFPALLRCGICGSKVDNMGRVVKDRLAFDAVRCACDARCTNAKGPVCSCHCLGKNHGAGMLAVVKFTVDNGPVPLIEARDATAATKAAAQFGEFDTLIQRVNAELKGLLDRRDLEGFLPRPAWDRMLEVERVRNLARSAKTHGGRMKLLQAFLGVA